MGAREQLANRVVDTLCEEWEKAKPGPLLSSTIYERLVAEGEHVPDGAINEVLAGLRATGAITAAGMHDSEAVRKHGNWAITAVQTDLLC